MVKSESYNMENNYTEEYDQFLNKDTLSELNKYITTSVNATNKVEDGSVSLKQTTISTIKQWEDVKSSDYIAWYSGWIIRWDWSAEFNDGTFRWALSAATINIPNSTTPLFSVDSSWNVIASSLQRNDYHWFIIFESVDGYSKITDWTWTITASSDGCVITTWDLTDNDSQIKKDFWTITSFDKNTKFKCEITVSDNDNQHINIVVWTAVWDVSATKHFWFLISWW